LLKSRSEKRNANSAAAVATTAANARSKSSNRSSSWASGIRLRTGGMGCGPSSSDDASASGDSKEKDAASAGEISIRSAVLIQKWYRRYKARLEARRRTTWMIYQSIEYSSESSQLHLYNFFNDMLSLTGVGGGGHPSGAAAAEPLKTCVVGHRRFTERLRQLSQEEEDRELLDLTSFADLSVEKSYRGPHLTFPLSASHVQLMIDSFRQGGQLHPRYLLQLLHETRLALRAKPNVHSASTSISKQVTVIGDLHGKLDDLLIVFYKNGLPDITNPYVFNGDFVDRGANSVEVAALLFACQLVWPTAVCVNRGNHEDHVMNCRYGFIKEVQTKYRHSASKIVKLFAEVFAWMPLATLIDDRILVAHGGISDKLDLELLRRLDRHRYLSALRPPGNDGEKVDYLEWRQVLDLLWSDPKPQAGCRPNTFRGGGCYFGPDVTESFLRKNKLTLLVRSHECKQDGYEFCHDGAVLTVFSASNYYEEGSNRGAYVKFDSSGKPHIVQYMASRSRRLPVGRRLSTVEEGALKGLRARVLASKTELLAAFQRLDPGRTGAIRLADWCQHHGNTRIISQHHGNHASASITCPGTDTHTSVIFLHPPRPWTSGRTSDHLAASSGALYAGRTRRLDKSGRLLYMTCFERVALDAGRLAGTKEVAASLTEAVYKNKEELETIFRIMDKDSSGHISLEEFRDSCRVLSEATGRQMADAEVEAMAKAMDLNNDGYIDFNEFLEAFRIVDNQ
uniref:Serine/threonine-protein phosphatase with EF-hands n=1 Tax=Macrostomum lignano TaxID=282301 RepID=A0A1I8G9V3_9PLAT